MMQNTLSEIWLLKLVREAYSWLLILL